MISGTVSPGGVSFAINCLRMFISVGVSVSGAIMKVLVLSGIPFVYLSPSFTGTSCSRTLF